MPVGSHYFSWWYWYSIITYAYRHYFSGAINMCCDLRALDLTSHTCLLLAEACFKSVTSVFSRTNLVSLPSLTAPLKTRKFHLENILLWLIGLLLCTVATDLADWKMAAIEGQPFELSLFGEVWGCHWKHAIFYIFAPCHQIRMRCSDHCSLCSCFFCLFSKCKDRQNEINSIKVTRNRQRREKLPVPAVIQLNSETLHPMWGLSGFVFFYLRCLCSAISM